MRPCKCGATDCPSCGVAKRYGSKAALLAAADKIAEMEQVMESALRSRLHLSEDDYQRLVALADGMGLTPEQYIRRIVLGREHD